jgi:membrane protein YqaA with SNARE-associated domain
MTSIPQTSSPSSPSPSSLFPSPSRWALHRRLYEWVLSFAHSKHASLALFCLSFAESSFFPIAPDILQIAMTLERRNLAWYYAGINSCASILGGVVGYAIGAFVWMFVSSFFFQYVFSETTFLHVEALYHRWDFWAIFIAAFTPIPYKVFTIAAGVFNISLPMFILASVIGRSARFFLVASLLWWFGPSIKRSIDKYFNALSLLLVILLVGGFVLCKYI